MIYVDTSVLVAYYCPESLSEVAEDKIVKLASRPAISRLTEVEFYSAVNKKTRSRELSKEDARKIVSKFLSHLHSGGYVVEDLEGADFDLAKEWLGQNDTPLRTLDALHLAIVFRSGARIITADKALGKAANKVGLKVEVIQ